MSGHTREFRWSAADAYLFDIDGTLLNSRDGVHYNAFNSAVNRYFGVSSKIDGVPVHGNTDPGIIRAVLEREGVAAADLDGKLPLLFDYMCDEVERNRAGLRPEVCPSALELVRALHDSGKLLGVASGNLERIAWMKLEASDLRGYFAFGSFSDHREKREDIFLHGIREARRRLGNERAQVYIVGDTPSDIKAARLAGAPVIAVATGIFSQNELLSHGPDTCVSCCADLLASM
ncbi:MAG: HAD family hydrolase [Acidobacteria bacterium]|nr:HAD family hydrolase [Acidobacteriota bacterium]